MYKQLVRPALFQFDSETIHNCSVSASRIASFAPVRALLSKLWSYEDSLLHCDVFGRPFRNPLGLAAGFDKRVEMVPFLAAVGFGHVEVGTITPKRQSGNPRPRIFRLTQDEALINRMGFPSDGIEAAEEHLSALKHKHLPIRLGVNIGKNKSTELERAADDYRACAKRLSSVGADWITVNISSPNTPGLRSLQTKEGIEQIVQAVREEVGTELPVLVKIAPDLKDAQLEELIHVLVDLRIDGVIASNTTTARDGLRMPIEEVGGLSGAPLYSKTKARVREIQQITQGCMPLIAVGGVHEWRQIVELLIEGASLIQIYTAFIFEGPAWPGRALRSVAHFCKSQGINAISELAGKREILPLLAEK
ncbi:MAG: quinone-dependent dihydroorotate dehydrogenase [Bdellovibrionota bacterium]|jgi:dihydroorotate dehydrogenase